MREYYIPLEFFTKYENLTSRNFNALKTAGTNSNRLIQLPKPL